MVDAVPPDAKTAASSPPALPQVTRLQDAETPTRELIATVIAIGEARGLTSLASPDGTWQAVLTVYDCVPVGDTERYAYEWLALAQAGEDSSVLVASQLINCGGLGAYGLEVLSWSADSRHVYYTDAREGVPDGQGAWTQPVLRFDTQTGTTERLPAGTLLPDGGSSASGNNGS